MGTSKNNFYSLIDYCNYHIKNTNEYNIVNTILKHISDYIFPTLDQISEESFISQASVLRIIHKIGFENYDGLRFAIAKEPPEILKKMQFRLLERGIKTIEEVANAELEMAFNNLKTTVENINYEYLEEIVNYIENSEFVIVFGDSWVISNSKSLQMDLIVGGITTIFLDKNDFSLDRLSDANENTLLIFNLISIVQIDKEVEEIIKGFKNQNTKTVLISQVPIEKIEWFSSYFDIVLIYGNMSDPLSGHYSLIMINRLIGDRFVLKKLEKDKLI